MKFSTIHQIQNQGNFLNSKFENNLIAYYLLMINPNGADMGRIPLQAQKATSNSDLQKIFTV